MRTNLEYRTVKLEIFQEPQSGAWFYVFPFEWSWYRSSQGYALVTDAREAGENHIDKCLSGTGGQK